MTILEAIWTLERKGRRNICNNTKCITVDKHPRLPNENCHCKRTKLFFLSCDYSRTLLYILSRSIIKGARKKWTRKRKQRMFLRCFFFFFFLSLFLREKKYKILLRVAIKKDRKKEMEERIIRKKIYIYIYYLILYKWRFLPFYRRKTYNFWLYFLCHECFRAININVI